MKKFKVFLGVVVLFLIVIFTYPYYTADTYTGTISGKEVKRIEGVDTYLVYLKEDDWTPQTFKIKDSLAYLQFRSSDLFWSLNNGDKVELKAYGWRIPLFSKYKNIYKVNILESFNDKQLKVLQKENIIYFEKDWNIYSYDLNNKKLNLIAEWIFNNQNQTHTLEQKTTNLNNEIKTTQKIKN